MRKKYKPFKSLKYKNKPQTIDGFYFPSKKEAEYYQLLKARTDHGPHCSPRIGNDIDFFLRQVPLHLPGNVKMVIDFLEFHKDGYLYFVDVKGKKTKQYIDKKKMVEAVYPVKIIER